MNSRKPILMMTVICGIIIAILSYVPYSLTLLSRAEQAVTNAVPVAPQAVNAAAAQVTPTKIIAPAFDAAAWYSTHEEEPEKHGVLIETLDGQRVLASHNADTAFNPASLTKLATTLIALRRLGANYRFETHVYVDGEVEKNGTLRGKLRVVSRDPTFGDASASMIARELKERGIKSVRDGIAVSPEFCFNFSDSPEESAKRLARVMKLCPEQKVEVINDAPKIAPLFVFRSYPLRDVLLYMNAHSSNFVADRIGDLVGGPEAIQQSLIDELELSAEQVRIQKASGLASNLLTPRGTVAIIRELQREVERQGLTLVDIMPVVTSDYGTLRHRFANTPLMKAAIGKTGTLTDMDGGMASLAGVIYTKDAGPILFAILDQGRQVAENRKLEDDLLIEVVMAEDLPVEIAVNAPRKLLPQTSFEVSDK